MHTPPQLAAARIGPGQGEQSGDAAGRGPDAVIGRRLLLAGALVCCGAGTGMMLPSGITPAPPGERRVGLGYALWHYDRNWQGVWGRPTLGYYASDDVEVQRQHAAWLCAANVDFILADWSNTLGARLQDRVGTPHQLSVEAATRTLFETWSNLQRSPRISLMIGNPLEPEAVSNGHLSAKADEIHALFVAQPQFARLLETYLGRPLLVIYVNTPSPYQTGVPAWDDPRFTVRWMTGFLSEQPDLLGADRVSRFGYWSWEDRGDPTFPLFQGHPEAMTVVAAWRGTDGQPSPGRQDGRTYRQEWARARVAGPHFVLAGTLNEWLVGEQPSVEVSKDVEPSVELGTLYLDLLREQAALFKAGR